MSLCLQGSQVRIYAKHHRAPLVFEINVLEIGNWHRSSQQTNAHSCQPNHSPHQVGAKKTVRFRFVRFFATQWASNFQRSFLTQSPPPLVWPLGFSGSLFGKVARASAVGQSEKMWYLYACGQKAITAAGGSCACALDVKCNRIKLSIYCHGRGCWSQVLCLPFLCLTGPVALWVGRRLWCLWHEAHFYGGSTPPRSAQLAIWQPCCSAMKKRFRYACYQVARPCKETAIMVIIK